MSPTKNESDQLPKNWDRGPQSIFFAKWLYGQKGRFQENTGNSTKMAIFGQLNSNLLS